MSFDPPRGPGKGAGNGNSRKDFTADNASEYGEKGGHVAAKRRAARAAKVAAGEAEYPEPAPTRAEIADLARSAIPGALQKLESLIHTSRSDMAVVNAFNALKETAYGKDSQAVEIKFDYEHMSEAELRDAIAAELGIKTIDGFAESQADAGRIAPPSTDGQPA